MTIYTYMFSVYGKLVIAGKYTLDEKEAEKEEKKLVPKPYQESVAVWISEYMEQNH